MSFKDLSHREQYLAVFNAAQRKKILNRKLLNVLRDIKSLADQVNEFAEFKEGHTKLDPIGVKAEIVDYYNDLKPRLAGLDPIIDQWIKNHEKASS